MTTHREREEKQNPAAHNQKPTLDSLKINRILTVCLPYKLRTFLTPQDNKMQKKIRLELRITEKTQGQLIELQRILTSKVGTNITKTEAIEIAIDKLLQSFVNNPQQARLI